MADPLRLTQGNQTLYRNPAVSAALGREAHQEQSGGARPPRVDANGATVDSRVVGIREAQTETRVAAMPREAHLESIVSAIPTRSVSVGGLQRLGALLKRDENLARKLAKNPRRALASVDFISERDKDVLAGIDPQLWSQLAAVSDKVQVAVSKRALAGLADIPGSPSDLAGDYNGAGGGALGWEGIGPPRGRGVGVGNGVFVHPGGRGGSPHGGEGDEGGGFEIPDYGFDHGNAGDPSVGGHRVGKKGGGGGSHFNDPLGYSALGMHGDAFEGGGISGGRLPSRAVLAGSGWRALHPGRDVSDDDPKKPDAGTPDAGAGGTTGTRLMPLAGPNAMTDSYTPTTPSVTAGELAMMGVGGLVGTLLGGWAGVALSSEAAAVGLGIGGLIGGGYGGYRIAHHFGWMPADDGFGGTGGGPRSQALNRFAGGQDAGRFIPADDGNGGNGRGPRSNVSMPGVYVPADDGYGGTGGGPRSMGGALTPSTTVAHTVRTARARPDSPWNAVSKPDPDNPSAPGPRS
jgi:hypothetical protein